MSREYAFDVFDIALRFGPVAIFPGKDLLPGEHRGQRSHHSCGGGGNAMVECGGMVLFWLDPVKPFNSPMDTVIDRIAATLDHRLPGRTLLSHDRDTRSMDYLSHGFLPMFAEQSSPRRDSAYRYIISSQKKLRRPD
jgi:hypothetical protein